MTRLHVSIRERPTGHHVHVTRQGERCFTGYTICPTREAAERAAAEIVRDRLAADAARDAEPGRVR